MLRLLERDITSGKGGSNEEDFCTVFAHISARIAEREGVHVNPRLHTQSGQRQQSEVYILLKDGMSSVVLRGEGGGTC